MLGCFNRGCNLLFQAVTHRPDLLSSTLKLCLIFPNQIHFGHSHSWQLWNRLACSVLIAEMTGTKHEKSMAILLISPTMWLLHCSAIANYYSWKNTGIPVDRLLPLSQSKLISFGTCFCNMWSVFMASFPVWGSILWCPSSSFLKFSELAQGLIQFPL